MQTSMTHAIQRVFQEVDSTELFLLPIWQSGYGCTGTESDPADCPDPGLGQQGTACFPVDSVELICSPGPDPGVPP